MVRSVVVLCPVEGAFDAVLCNANVAKVVFSHGLELRHHVDEWFLVNMIFHRNSDFVAPIFLQSSGGVLFTA